MIKYATIRIYPTTDGARFVAFADVEFSDGRRASGRRTRDTFEEAEAAALADARAVIEGEAAGEAKAS